MNKLTTRTPFMKWLLGFGSLRTTETPNSPTGPGALEGAPGDAEPGPPAPEVPPAPAAEVPPGEPEPGHAAVRPNRDPQKYTGGLPNGYHWTSTPDAAKLPFFDQSSLNLINTFYQDPANLPVPINLAIAAVAYRVQGKHQDAQRLLESFHQDYKASTETKSMSGENRRETPLEPRWLKTLEELDEPWIPRSELVISPTSARKSHRTPSSVTQNSESGQNPPKPSAKNS